MSVAASAPAQARRSGKPLHLVRNQTIVHLSQTGAREISAHEGDVLAFDMTYDQSASTGYRWQGPKVAGSVFGKPKEVFTKNPNFKEPKAVDGKAPVGAPEHRGTTISYIKCLKKGKGTLTYVFSRSAVDAEHAKGDKVCSYAITVK